VLLQWSAADTLSFHLLETSIAFTFYAAFHILIIPMSLYCYSIPAPAHYCSNSRLCLLLAQARQARQAAPTSGAVNNYREHGKFRLVGRSCSRTLPTLISLSEKCYITHRSKSCRALCYTRPFNPSSFRA